MDVDAVHAECETVAPEHVPVFLRFNSDGSRELVASDRLTALPPHLFLARAIDTRLALEPAWGTKEVLDWYQAHLLSQVGASAPARTFDTIVNDIQASIVTAFSKLGTEELQHDAVQALARAVFRSVGLPENIIVSTT